MHFMQNFINLEIIYVNHWLTDKAVDYHCIDVSQKLDDLPLFWGVNEWFFLCYIVTM